MSRLQRPITRSSGERCSGPEGRGLVTHAANISLGAHRALSCSPSVQPSTSTCKRSWRAADVPEIAAMCSQSSSSSRSSTPQVNAPWGAATLQSKVNQEARSPPSSAPLPLGCCDLLPLGSLASIFSAQLDRRPPRGAKGTPRRTQRRIDIMTDPVSRMTDHDIPGALSERRSQTKSWPDWAMAAQG